MMAQWNTTFHGVPQGAQHSCCVKWQSLWTSERDNHSRTSKCHLILGSTDTHTAPTLAKFSVKTSVLNCRNCTVCQCSWCCMQGISLLVTPATIWSPIYPNLWMSSRIYIFQLYMAHTSVPPTVVYCLQSKLPTHQSVNISIHNQTMAGWCIMNWNGRERKWSWPVCSITATFAWRDREKPMKIC